MNTQESSSNAAFANTNLVEVESSYTKLRSKLVDHYAYVKLRRQLTQPQNIL